MFILDVLLNKDRKTYGMFTPSTSCLFVQSMHDNSSNASPFMCSKSYGAILHVEFLNMITYEGPIGGSKCLLIQLVWSLLTNPFKKMCEVTIGVASHCMVKPQRFNDQYLGNHALKINLKVVYMLSTTFKNTIQFVLCS